MLDNTSSLTLVLDSWDISGNFSSFGYYHHDSDLSRPDYDLAMISSFRMFFNHVLKRLGAVYPNFYPPVGPLFTCISLYSLALGPWIASLGSGYLDFLYKLQNFDVSFPSNVRYSISNTGERGPRQAKRIRTM